MGLTDKNEDFDFTDDVAFPSHTEKDIQEKTGIVDRTARSVGLKIHTDKISKAKAKSNKKINIRGQDLEEVEHFKYLGSYIFQIPRKLHFCEQQHRKGSLVENKTSSRSVQQTEKHFEINSFIYSN